MSDPSSLDTPPTERSRIVGALTNHLSLKIAAVVLAMILWFVDAIARNGGGIGR